MAPGQDEPAAAAAGVSVDAIKASTQQLAAACEALKAQRVAREANLNPPKPDESELARLDSSIKKNGALIKKLRQLGADNRQQLLAEAAKLNLSKYVSEAVAALSEVPLKTSDVPAALDMAAALHKRYPDFGAAFVLAVARVAAGGKAPADDDRLAARRQRGALRLLPELVAAGIASDAAPLLAVVKALVSGLDFAGEREASLHAAVLLGSFIKAAGPLLLGAPPEGAAAAGLPQELLHSQDLSGLPADVAAAVGELQQQQHSLEAELKQRYQLPPEQRALLLKQLDRSFEAASSALVEAHRSLAAADRDNAKAFATKGELPEGAAAEYEASRKAYEGLHRAVTAMAEALHKDLPDLAEDAFTRLGADGAAGATGAAGQGGEGGGGPAEVELIFEDPETRAFYEQLPDLWSLVPTVLLRDATSRRPTTDEQGDASTTSAGPPAAAAAAAAAAAVAEEATPPGSPSAAAAAAVQAAADDAPAAAAPAPEHPSAVDAVLGRLGCCVSRDLADELAVNFCYSNSRGGRKRLVRALVDVPRGNLALLPYYARVAATISQAYPEVAAGVVAAVEAEFDAQLAKKDLTRAGEEPRLRTARYLAELVKFRLAPPSGVLLRLKLLLDDFMGTAVDAAAALVESAGRFLLRLPESKVRMENLLGVMMRLRNARNLDSRQTNAIDSAYWACRPPDKALQRRRRPPLQEYIRHLIFEQLGDGSIVDVLKKLMKLPWATAEPYLLKCLLKVSRVRFNHIALIASLAGGLAQYHDSLGVGLVDLVLEDVRWGLDHPNAGNYQQRLAQVRLLGECYNYMLLDSRAVFDVLYCLISHGHDSPEAAARLDPPDDFFRVRMVIALLNTCGSYFSKGAARRRLDRFLTFMQAYVLAKQPLPLDVDADLQDMYDSLRPGLQRFSSYPEAAACVHEILARDAAANAAGLAPIEEEEDEESDDSGDERGRKTRGRGGEGGESDGGSGSEEEDEETDGHDEYDRGEGGSGAEEDDEFEREYNSLLQECQGGRAGASGPAAAAAAAAPVLLAGGGGSGQPQLHHAQHSHHPQQQASEEEEEGPPAIAFKLLMKRGGKDDRTKELHIPADAAIAVGLLAKKETEAAERSQIKALVLEANQREEAEAAAAAAAERAAAAAAGGRRGGGSRGFGGGHRPGGGGGGGVHKYQTPAGGPRGVQPGPQLTIRHHVSQLTGERPPGGPGSGSSSDRAYFERQQQGGSSSRS